MTTRRDLTIVQALVDPALFGGLPTFWDLASWSRWRVFLKAVYGLPLDGDELAVFRTHTGRTTYDPPRRTAKMPSTGW